MSDTSVKAWYQKKIVRDGGIKKKALGVIMRKLSGTLWHVGRGAKFDASPLFNTSKPVV